MHDLFPNRTDGCHSSSRQKQKRLVGVAFKDSDLPKHSASVSKLDRTKILGKSCLADYHVRYPNLFVIASDLLAKIKYVLCQKARIVPFVHFY